MCNIFFVILLFSYNKFNFLIMKNKSKINTTLLLKHMIFLMQLSFVKDIAHFNNKIKLFYTTH